MRRFAVAIVFGAALLLGACAVQNQAGDGGADGAAVADHDHGFAGMAADNALHGRHQTSGELYR